MNTRLKSKTNIFYVFRNRLIIIFLNIKKYYFKFFEFDSHILTQYALSTFKIKNRKNNVSHSLLNIYSVVDSTNILCIQYQHSNFSIRFKV